MRVRWAVCLVSAALFGLSTAPPAGAVNSKCEECHAKVTPGIVKDFNRGKMSKMLTCASCHGDAHQSADDAAKAVLPTVKTCQGCHQKQAKQYLAGKHAKGLMAIEALPFLHHQPKAFAAGQKGCNGCHNLGIVTQKQRQNPDHQYYKYGMDCQSCHTRHAFSVEEARQPAACETCHTGFDHAQWEMWHGSKHGVAYRVNPKAHRGPTCQDCHMPKGNHEVRTAWGFLGLKLPMKDKEWAGYQVSIMKALGVLDANGKPTALLDVVKSADMLRLDQASFDHERKRITDTCQQCHSKNFVDQNMKNADLMVKESDKLLAQAIEIIAGLRRDGIIPIKKGEGVYPPLLEFYDVDTPIEETLYEMFMDHRMKTIQASFHIYPDYTTWYGFAKMKKDLVEIKAMAAQMRAAHARGEKLAMNTVPVKANAQ